MEKATYRITVKGQLGTDWAEWFNGWTISAKENGTTVLSRPDADQAALHGILTKIRNLNLTLISVHPDINDYTQEER